MEKIKTDYRALFLRYVDHVEYCEGWAFLEKGRGVPGGLTDADIDLISALREDAAR